MIFSSGSPSDKFFAFLLSALLLMAAFPPQSFSREGIPWKLEEPRQNLSEVNDLLARFPLIRNGEELSGLLCNLGRLYPFAHLEARLHNGEWLISGEAAQLVTEIRIHLVNRQLKKAMEVIRQKYLRRVDSSAIRTKVTDSITNLLIRHGYLLSKVHFQSSQKANGTVYEIRIDEEEPCRINQVHFPFDLPDDIRFAVGRGDICEMEKLTDAVDSLEDQLLAMGYQNLRINLDSISYSEDGRNAEVFIQGELGKRIIYDVIDHSKLFLTDDIFPQQQPDKSEIQLNSPDSVLAELNKFYHARGYEDVRISGPEIQTTGKDQEHYTYHVIPGIQYYVTQIRFEGNRYFNSASLRESMHLTGFWESSVLLNRDELNQSLAALEASYHKEGFWDVKIHEPKITRDPIAGTAQMLILIREGEQRIFDGLEFLGNTFFTDEELSAYSQATFGDPMDKARLLELQEKIRNAYLKAGFHYAEIKTTVSHRSVQRQRPSTAKFRITEGPRVRIGGITITGLLRTDPAVVRRELRFASGDWYNPELISLSKSALMKLGFFRSVQIIPEERVAFLDQSPILNMLVEVHEGNAGSVSFGPGYNYRRGLHYSGEFSYQNLWGTGRQASVKVSFSEEKNQNPISNPGESKGKVFLGRKLAAGYVEPWLFGLPVNGQLAISHKGTADEIWHLSNMFDLSMIWKPQNILPDTEWTPFYNLRFNKEEGSSRQDLSLASTGSSRIASIGLRYRQDRRDDVSWPGKGELIHAEVSFARPDFGGDYHFFRWEFSFKHFFSLRDGLVWTNGISLGAFEGVEKKNDDRGILPYSERYQAGGVSTVRGFQQKLGPWVSTANQGAPPQTTGGSRRSLLRTELRQRLSSNFALSLFFDSGNTFFTQQEEKRIRELFQEGDQGLELQDNLPGQPGRLLKKPWELERLHYISAGASASIITPVGPINAYLAWPISEPRNAACSEDKECFIRRKERDPWLRKFQFYINIGTDF
ncbi:MAG: BamA/TamA family outer membrane protein [Deltaproteobacteria bacterium]|nr:BamA/TamA family outer membrane protein [Deltaproteobacteria bacterium]